MAIKQIEFITLYVHLGYAGEVPVLFKHEPRGT